MPPIRYRSTRGGAENYSFEKAVLAGLATDGGLFIPDAIPLLPDNFLTAWQDYTFQELAVEIISRFVDEQDIPAADLRRLVDQSFATFSHSLVTPIVALPGDEYAQRYVLELFHGPTFAFKDVALQFLGNLFEFFLQRAEREPVVDGFVRPQRLTVVGATSGDTGSAAIYGLRGKKNVSVYILHPHGKVSPIQQAQMTTVLDSNVHNIAMEGSFDDCQEIVKSLFSDSVFSARHNLAAVNSINWARILVQIVYYFQAYFQLQKRDALTGPLVFSVPTGNFGDILAGYYAKQLGLPIARLIIATNENDILHRFMTTGTYQKLDGDNGGVKETLAPAMDIIVSSNFERLLWYLAYASALSYPEAGKQVAEWMSQLRQQGSFSVGPETLHLVQQTFSSARVNDDTILDTIRRYYQNTGYLLDPHTAVGVQASEEGDKSRIVVCLSTAHPAKFAEAVQRALADTDFDFDKILPDAIRDLADRERRFVYIERKSAQLVRKVIEENSVQV